MWSVRFPGQSCNAAPTDLHLGQDSLSRGASLSQDAVRTRSGMSREASGVSGESQEMGPRSQNGGSVERAQLSPSLMQRIQKVKQNASVPNTAQARELSGWGTGIPNAAQVRAPCSPTLPSKLPESPVLGCILMIGKPSGTQMPGLQIDAHGMQLHVV